MKHKKLMFLLIFSLLFSSIAEEGWIDPPVEELEEFMIGYEEGLEYETDSLEEIIEPSFVDAAPEIFYEEPPIPSKDFNVKLTNFSNYSIVALNNADIQSHIRGSIWVGGTLTGNNYNGMDDGSINHQPSGYESFVYNNESELYFQGRTNYQSPTAYNQLSYECVENVRYYWNSLLPVNNFTDNWEYIEPDANGHVDLNLWNYQSTGNDEDSMTIKKVYWTDAKTVSMGGLAGHLIAPFANIDITWCNHCGSIVGWNITTRGEAHINTWVPEIIQTTPTPTPEPSPTPTPEPGKIILKKTLVNDIWHIRCDVMDGTTFQAGGGIWKTDVIMNPTKKTSKEGHRSNKCGDADHWIIWVSAETGKPFRMDEIKSGATGGTLPTMIFKEHYSLSDAGLDNWGQLEPEMTDKVELYKTNFIEELPIEDIVPGQRIYWVTWNGDQRWYHSGVPYVAAPTFMFYIDGEPYPIVAGNYLELSDVEPGAHEIREDVSIDDYIITVFGSADVEGTTSVVDIVSGETLEIEYVNEIITPPTVPPSPPPTLPPSPSQSPEVTESPSPSPTVEVTESPSPSPTVEITESPSPSPSPTAEVTKEPSPSPTVEVTEEPSPSPTAEVTESPSPSPTVEITEEPSPSPTTEVTEEPSPSPTVEVTEEPSPSPTVETTEEPSPSPTVEVTEEPSPSPTTEVTEEPSPSPTIEVTESPSPSPIVEVTESPTSEVSESPSPSPEVTESPTPEVTESPTTEVTITPEITQSPTPDVSESPTPEITETPTESPTPEASESPTPETTNSPIPEVTESPAPEVTESPEITESPAPEVTESPSPEITESPIITESPSPTITESPTAEIVEEKPTISPSLKPTTEVPIVVEETSTPGSPPTVVNIDRSVIEEEILLEEEEKEEEEIKNTPIFSPTQIRRIQRKAIAQTRANNDTPKSFAAQVQNFDEEELEDLVDLFEYGTPLYGALLATGDNIPLYSIIFTIMGFLSILLFFVVNKKIKGN